MSPNCDLFSNLNPYIAGTSMLLIEDVLSITLIKDPFKASFPTVGLIVKQ